MLHLLYIAWQDGVFAGVLVGSGFMLTARGHHRTSARRA
jgi:hypothetical protein